MKASKHTPAPWRYEKTNGSPTTGQHMIAGATPGYLAEVRDCGSGDVEANAILIAAAPDLLEAALKFREYVGLYREEKGTSAMYAYTEFCRMMDAAIAKATGEPA